MTTAHPTTYCTMGIDLIGAITFLRGNGLSFDQIASDCRMTLAGKPICGEQLRRWYFSRIKRRADPMR